MEFKSQLEKKIEAKRLEIMELETKIREANAYLQGLQEALRVLPREPGSSSSVQTLRPGSDMAKTRDFLAKLGRPAYITEILEGIGKPSLKPKESGVSNSLASYVRKGEIFKRTAPNTFALIDFEELTSSNMNRVEPPANFGSDDDSDSEEYVETPQSTDDIPF